jgi:hypothetical protein
MKTRIAEDDLQSAARRRIALKYRLQIFSQGIEHRIPTFPSVG